MSCLHQLLIDRSADSTSCCSHWLVTLADDLTLGTSRHSSMVVSGIAGPHAAAVDFAAAWSRARWIDTASCIGCVQETGLQTTCVISSGSAPSFCGSCVVFLAVPVLGPSPAGSDQNELPSSSRPCSVQPASLRYLRASSAGNGRPAPGRVIGGTSTCIWFGLSFAMSSLLIFWVVGATLLPPLAVGHVRAVELVQPVPDPAHVASSNSSISLLLLGLPLRGRVFVVFVLAPRGVVGEVRYPLVPQPHLLGDERPGAQLGELPGKEPVLALPAVDPLAGVLVADDVRGEVEPRGQPPLRIGLVEGVGVDVVDHPRPQVRDEAARVVQQH